MTMWAGQWHSSTKLDGETRYVLYEDGLPKLFKHRKECREWIKSKYGYIANRPDLKSEPHGWRMPQAIKVELEYVKENK